MKKAVRITAWILGLLFLLQVGGMVVLQSPRVQTYLGRKVIEGMQDRMDADISFQQASVRPFDALVLDDVLIRDRAPEIASMDTVLYVKHLSTRFSIMGLFKGGSINVSRLHLDGGCFHLTIEKDPYRKNHTSTNLQRIFRIQHKEEKEAVYSWGDILHARSVVVDSVHFRMENLVGAARYEERGIVIPESVIDWNHLNLVLEHIRVNNLRVQDDLITASAQEMSVQELETGLRLEDLSARKVRVGKANTHVEDFQGRLSPATTLNITSLDLNGKLDDYEEFEEMISLDVRLAEGTSVDMRSIAHFSPGLETMGFRGRVKGHVFGPVANLNLSDVAVEGLDEDVRVRASGRITGLPDTDNTRLDFQVRELSFELKDLDDFVKDWAADVNLRTDHMAPDERFKVSGTVTGLLNRMTFAGDIDSRIGHISTEVTLANAVDHMRGPLSIGGRLETRDIHMGRILAMKELGAVSLTSRLEATLPRSGGMHIRLDTLSVDRLQLLGYNYSGIEASGHYEAKDYDLGLKARDPNLQLTAKATYREDAVKDGQFDARLSIGHANLQALNLDRRGKSLAGIEAQASLTRENGETQGTLTTSGTFLENAEGRHLIPDVTVQLEDAPSGERITLRSDMLDAQFSGDRPVTDFLEDLKGLFLRKDLSALSQTHVPPSYSGATYEATVSVHRKLQELLAFVAPGVYVDNGTTARLSIDRTGLMKADVTSGRLALREQFIKDMKLHVDNGFEALTGEITGSTVAIAGGRLSNNRLTFYADDNQVGLGYVFENEAEENTHAQFYATGELSRGEKGLCITARALPSNIYYKGEGWGISSGDIRYESGNVQIDRLMARHENQQLLVDGGYSRSRPDTLSLTMDQFDLGLVNTIAGESIPKLKGRLTGRALVVSSDSPTPGLLASLVCDSTAIAGRRLGQLALSSIWDEDSQRFRARMHNSLDGRRTIRGTAFLAPETQETQVDLELDRFELGYAEHFLNTIFHEFTGFLSGHIKLDGKTSQLSLSSENLRLEEGRLTLDFTRVPYHVDGPLSLDKKGLNFDRLTVTDGEGGTGTVTGGIALNLSHLDDIRMNTHVDMTGMRALALPRGVNPLAYGNVYATGKVDITGPLNRILLSIDATSAGNGEFHLPLGSSSSTSSRELLTFRDAPSPDDEDPYELMMQAARETYRQQSDLRFSARIRATPELRVFIDIGENSLNAVGSGTIEVESSNAQGFSLGGDYTIQDGNFHFSALNVVSRNFTIQDGSTLRFNGDVWNTDLDVKGRYTTKASLSNLLPSYYDEGETGSGRRTVYCGINISGKLRNPEVDFDIEVPDLNPVIQGQVESALNSEDKVQKQFVYLLIAGNFLPTDESGITANGSEVLLSNVSSIMSGQLNNIFQKLDIPLDLGLNYQTTQAGRDLFDVAVSTQLFNNRVIVNGTVGNKQLVGGATTNEIAGDLDIEIKLNRSGSLRMSLFSHSADQYTYYLDNSQRNGGGITYQREFNSFGQFFRELFAGRKKREKMALEAARRQQENVVLQIDTTGKSKVIHEIR